MPSRIFWYLRRTPHAVTWARPGRPLRRGWCLARGEVVLGLEGRVAVEHLEEEDAERPIVDRLAVPALEDQLGGEVPTGRAAPVQEGTKL